MKVKSMDRREIKRRRLYWIVRKSRFSACDNHGPDAYDLIRVVCVSEPVARRYARYNGYIFKCVDSDIKIDATSREMTDMRDNADMFVYHDRAKAYAKFKRLMTEMAEHHDAMAAYARECIQKEAREDKK